MEVEAWRKTRTVERYFSIKIWIERPNESSLDSWWWRDIRKACGSGNDKWFHNNRGGVLERGIIFNSGGIVGLVKIPS